VRAGAKESGSVRLFEFIAAKKAGHSIRRCAASEPLDPHVGDAGVRRPERLIRAG
jgi:hypothetical protein